MTAITESKDVDSIPVDELVGSLQSDELDLSKEGYGRMCFVLHILDL